MERIGLVGISWKELPPEGLGVFSVQRSERGAWLAELSRAANLEEAFVLVTCNRVEVGFVVARACPIASVRLPVFEALMGRAAEAGEAERRLRAWAGEGAVEHTFLVAAGLESARLGETEVARQVREARDLAQSEGLLGERLQEMLDSALRVAAEVHRDTGLGVGRVSLAQIALEHVRERLALHDGVVALVGVSPMTENCAQDLAERKTALLWVNRSLPRAEAAARRWGGQALSLEQFCLHPPSVEAVICATGAPHAVLDCSALERMAAANPSGLAPWVVDLAVPADVDAERARAAGVPRLGMDAITERARSSEDQRRVEAADARILVDEALDRFARRRTDRRVGPVLAAVQRRYQEVAHEGVQRLLRRGMLDLSATQEAALVQWSQTLARRFAHLPTGGIKRLADRYGLEAVSEFLSASEMVDLEGLPEPLPEERRAAGRPPDFRIPERERT